MSKVMEYHSIDDLDSVLLTDCSSLFLFLSPIGFEEKSVMNPATTPLRENKFCKQPEGD